MTSELGRIMKMKRTLEDISLSETPQSTDEVMDILKVLQTCSMTLDLLQKSGIGVTVNRIRKEVKDAQVAACVKKLIKSWKRFLPDTGSCSAHKSTTPNSHLASNKSTTLNSARLTSSKPRPVKRKKPRPIVQPYAASFSVAPLSSTTPQPTTHPPSPVLSSNPSSALPASPDLPEKIGESLALESLESDSDSKPPVLISQPLDFPASVSGCECTPSTGCDVRDRCRELLVKALKKDCEEVTAEEEYKFYNLSSQIEECVFEIFGDTGSKYKQRVRSRVSNLGDAKNLALRQQVIAGHISPTEIANMTAEEMASDSMKELRQKLTQEAIRDAQVAQTDGAGGENCDLIRCPECSKSKCSYTQAQTLCSDEPMTTFAYCNDCGHRWIFY